MTSYVNTSPLSEEAGDFNVPFSGYGSPTFTPVPDFFLDFQYQDLSEAELRVLLYIFRHTYGYRKRLDAISLSQFEFGITTEDDRVIDRGAGVGIKALMKALAKLEEKRFVFRHQSKKTNGGSGTTVYELNVDGKPHYYFEQKPNSKIGKPKYRGGHPFGDGGVPAQRDDTKDNMTKNKDSVVCECGCHSDNNSDSDLENLKTDKIKSKPTSTTPELSKPAVGAAAAVATNTGESSTDVAELVLKLGYSQNIAEQLLATATGIHGLSSEQIKRWFEIAASKKNPAGYFRKMLEEGNEPPAPRPAKAAKRHYDKPEPSGLYSVRYVDGRPLLASTGVVKYLEAAHGIVAPATATSIATPPPSLPAATTVDEGEGERSNAPSVTATLQIDDEDGGPVAVQAETRPPAVDIPATIKTRLDRALREKDKYAFLRTARLDQHGNLTIKIHSSNSSANYTAADFLWQLAPLGVAQVVIEE